MSEHDEKCRALIAALDAAVHAHDDPLVAVTRAVAAYAAAYGPGRYAAARQLYRAGEHITPRKEDPCLDTR